MYNNNNNNGVLRSPSLSSGSGSRNGGTATSSTSASSATTTMSSTMANGSGTTVVGSITGGATSGVSDVKLKRFLEHNQRLKEQLEMRRISVSEASQSLIKFVTSTKDSLLPTLWGNAPSDPFSKQTTGCCIIS
ncbi:hypothetical protein BGX27_006810 [Mortierella sp. AM989]|nr:hypothetical protein BGX27_006810 [Mortierella sp. AM989]